MLKNEVLYSLIIVMSVHINDSFVYEKHYSSGIVYLSTDSQPELCIHFLKNIKLRVLLDECEKNKVPLENEYPEMDDADNHTWIVKPGTPTNFDSSGYEIIPDGKSLDLLDGQEHVKYTVQDFSEDGVEGKLLKSLCSGQSEYDMIVVSVNESGEVSVDTLNIPAQTDPVCDSNICKDVHTKSIVEELDISDYGTVQVLDCEVRKESIPSDTSHSQLTHLKITPEPPIIASKNKICQAKSSDSKNKFHCKICSKSFTSKDLFDGHYMADSGSYECTLCHQSFPFEGYLLAHICSSHKDSLTVGSDERVKYACHICGKLSGGQNTLRRHMCFHSREHYYKCCICGQKLKKRIDKFHMSTKHAESSSHVNPSNGAFCCRICSKIFRTKDLFDNHFMANPGSFECTICHQSLPYKGHLLAHISFDHKNSHTIPSNGRKSCVCHLCGHHSREKRDLIRHMRCHSQEYYYKCCLCGQKLKSRNDRLHLAKKHGRCSVKDKNEMDSTESGGIRRCKGNGPSNQLPIPIVGSETMVVSHLKKKSRKGAQCRIRCNYCFGIFQDSQSYSSHFHAEKGVHKCGLCSEVFPFKGNLQAHFRAEHGVTSGHRTCGVCGLKAVYHLKRHLRLHSIESYYKCCICHKLVGSKTLRIHMVSHNKGNNMFQSFRLMANSRRREMDRFLVGKNSIKSSYNTSPRILQERQNTRDHQEESTVDWEKPDTNESGPLVAISDENNPRRPMLLKPDRNKNQLYSFCGFKIVCKLCQNDFGTMDEFRNHIRAEGSSHKCETCQQVFPYQAYLWAHIRIEHMEDNSSLGLKKISCQFCHYFAEKQSSLRNHMITHTKEHLYRCCVCSKTGKGTRDLRLHIDCGLHEKSRSQDGTVEDSLLQDSMQVISSRGDQESGDSETVGHENQANDCLPNSMIKQVSCETMQCKYCKEIFTSKMLYDMHNIWKAGSHKCAECGIVLPTKAHLFTHISVRHTSDVKFSCYLCKLVFKEIKDLRQHMIKHTDEHYCYKCCICSQSFKTRKSLQNHIIKHETVLPKEKKCCTELNTSQDKSFRAQNKCVSEYVTQCENAHEGDISVVKNASKSVKCDLCSNVFQTTEAFDEHMRPTPEPRKCEWCDQTFLHKNDALVHMSIDHHAGREGRQAKCHVCGEMFIFGRLIHHMASHTGEPVYKCCVCGKFMNFKKNSGHVCQNSKGGMIKCSCCNRLFHSRSEMFKHKNSNLKCSLCGEIFPNRTSRNMHYQMVHPDEILRCSKCDRLFSTEEELNNHMKYHATQKKKQCPVCGKFFSVMKLHLLTHRSYVDDSETYLCDQCPKRFTRNSAFRAHKMSHKTVADYKCHLCTRTFMTTCSYRKHLKTHMTFKPHVCQICGKQFHEKSRLNAHHAVHSKVKSFICTVCNRKFTSRSMANAHMKAIHSVERFQKQDVSEETLLSDNIREVGLHILDAAQVEEDDISYEEMKAATASIEYDKTSPKKVTITLCQGEPL